MMSCIQYLDDDDDQSCRAFTAPRLAQFDYNALLIYFNTLLRLFALRFAAKFPV